MSKSQRTKGAAGEREWCEVLKNQGFADAARQLGQARDGGGDVRIGGVLYEVKRRKGLAARQFLDQAVKSAVDYKAGEMPAVAMREDGRTDWMVLLRAEDYFTLIKRRQDAQDS